MRTRLTEFLKNNSNWLALIAAFLGFGYYALQSWDLAHHLTTMVWDEAMYLYKGYLFSIGDYLPFEDFGPWTNQMPVSFLIPGYVQKWFGLGMRSGRMYAVVLGLLMVIGLWLAAYRVGGRWWAAGIVWVVALNSGWIKGFSQVYSQGLVSFFFAWMLALAAGRDRKTWELCLAAVLAGLAGMSRINVFPVVFLFMLYVIWQYGWKKGAWVIGAGLVPVVLFHALYWPEVLKIWAYWIPPELYTGIIEFRSPWREVFVPDGFSWWPVSAWLGDAEHLAWDGIYSLFLALRASFVPFFGVLVSLLLWPTKENWKAESQRKFSFFLVVVYLLMLAVHIWAAIGGKTCPFSCLPGYMLFFNFFGLLLLPSVMSSWKSSPGVWRIIVLVAVIFLLIFALEYFYDYDYPNLRMAIGQKSLGINLPRYQIGERLPGSVPVLTFIENKFGAEAFPLRQYILHEPGFKLIISWLKILGISFLLPAGVYFYLKKRLKKTHLGFARVALLTVFGVGVIFAPSRFFVQGLDSLVCEEDVIASHEQVGAEIQAVIPAGSSVFWDVKSDMLLLYLPDVDVFLPQLNFRFTLADDPRADWNQLQKFGWWNMELGEEWISQADYIAVENRFYNGLWQWDQRVDGGEFEVLLRSSNPESCRGGISNVVVLERVNED